MRTSGTSRLGSRGQPLQDLFTRQVAGCHAANVSLAELRYQTATLRHQACGILALEDTRHDSSGILASFF